MKNRKKDLPRLNTAESLESVQIDKDIVKYNKPIQRGIDSILSKDWNLKRPYWHVGDIL